MSQRILVIGLGRFGTSLAESLTQSGCEVMAVDATMDQVDAVKTRVAYAIELDSTSPEALRSIDAARFSMVVVAMGDAFEAAALTVAALKEVGAPFVIARATTSQHGRILKAAGAARVIELEAEMGQALGRELGGRSPSGGTSPGA